jgi:hypothetical protein
MDKILHFLTGTIKVSSLSGQTVMVLRTRKWTHMVILHSGLKVKMISMRKPNNLGFHLEMVKMPSLLLVNIQAHILMCKLIVMEVHPPKTLMEFLDNL